MLKHILVVFILGVLLRYSSADIECFLEKVGGVVTLPEDEKTLCSGFVDTLRDKLKSCKVTKVSFDKLDSFVKERCTEGTQLKKDMESSKQCIKDHSLLLFPCIPRIDPELTSMKARLKEACKKRQDIYNCIKKAVGEPCGTAGLNFITKSQEAEESYTKDICALVGGAAANSFFMWTIVLCVSFLMLMSY